LLCSKCGRRESSIRVGGRDLCVLCANNEVTKRAYRVLSEAGALHTEAIYTFSSPLFQGWNNLIGRLLARMGKKNEPKLYELPFESHGSVDEMLHLMLTYRKEGLILLPITTDFLTAYLIYSISKGHGPFYSNIYSPHFTLGLAKFVSPMIRTSALELAGVGKLGLTSVMTSLIPYICGYYPNSTITPNYYSLRPHQSRCFRSRRDVLTVVPLL